MMNDKRKKKNFFLFIKSISTDHAIVLNELYLT